MGSYPSVLGLVAGLAFGLVAAPDSAALQKCLDACDAPASSTDKETCKLQCRQKAERGGAPIKQWKRTELKGGSPDPNVEGGTTTTTVERGPNGTTTTVTKTDRAGRKTVRRYPGDRTKGRRSTKGIPFTIARRMQAWCFLGCSRRETFGSRASCRSRCQTPKAVRRPKPPRKKAAKPRVDPAACRSDCAAARNGCVAACPARNADRATCELQCSEATSACRKRCG